MNKYIIRQQILNLQSSQETEDSVATSTSEEQHMIDDFPTTPNDLSKFKATIAKKM